METDQIFAKFVGESCEGCQGPKRKHNAFCLACYRQLPPRLRNSLWKRFGQGFEEAYQGCLSWFRQYPFQGEHRARQKSLWEDAS